MDKTKTINKILIAILISVALLLSSITIFGGIEKQKAHAAVSPRMLTVTAEHHGIIVTLSAMYIGPEGGTLHMIGTDSEQASCTIVNPSTEEVLAGFKVWTDDGASPGDLYDANLFVTCVEPERLAGQTMKLFIDFYDGSSNSYTLTFSSAGTSGVTLGKLPKLITCVGKLKQPGGDTHKNTGKLSPQTGYDVSINPFSADKQNTFEGFIKLISNLFQNTIGKLFVSLS